MVHTYQSLVYIMLSVASTMAAQDMIQVLIPTIPHPFWFATPENEWAELFWRYIPSWAAISNEAAVKGYFMGESTLYTAQHIKAWLIPVVAWSSFIFALVFVMLCLTVILRRRWTEEEKLSYPIIQLALEMTDAPAFFRKRLMWMGFGLAGLVNLLNGLHFLYPEVPGLGGKPYDIAPLFTSKPWDAMGWTPIAVYPFVIGLGFFIPLDISLSCWVFYFFWKGQKIIGSVLGLRSLPNFPYIEEQSFGAYIAIGLLALWMGKKHLKQVIRVAFNRNPKIDSWNEPLGYRIALLGVLLGMTFITVFCHKAGMSIWVILSFFAIYYALSIAISRIRTEMGSPVHDLPFAGPGQVITTLFGTRRLGPSNLTMFAFLFFFNRGYRGHPMPHQLEGFKIAEKTGINNRRLLVAMIIATVVGVYASSWAFLDASYKLGATANWRPQTAFVNLQRWLTYPSSPDYPAIVAILSGLMFSMLLMVMRTSFLWWKLHPVGYAISGTWGMNHFWFSIFISWLAKTTILRHGGLRDHRQGIPFFLGLILGDLTIGSLWSLIGIWLHQPMYSFLF